MNKKINIHPIEDNDDSTMTMETGLDITDQKRSISSFHDAFEKLNQLMQDKTIDLQNVTKELARSNADLEQYGMAISHDLKDPLRSIKTFSQIISKKYIGVLDPQGTIFFNRIIRNVEIMEQMINHLFEFSRIQISPMNLVQIDLNSVVQEVLNNLNARIEDSQAIIEVEKFPSVLGDNIQLTRVFQNLIGNALKFRKPHEPLHIHVGVVSSSAKNVQISIQDNGIGINPLEIPQLFKLFKRINTSEDISGAGVGLAMCHRIIDRLGGRIWVESELGNGSNFIFTLQKVF